MSLASEEVLEMADLVESKCYYKMGIFMVPSG